MTPRRRYLPSMQAFATFEVAAKHLSFTLAATELNVTQAAVSQQIRGLEKALGCLLFLRLHNALELTGDGRRLLGAVTAGLDGICEAIAGIDPAEAATAITISGTQAVIAYWLAPRLDAFRALHPEARFVLLASDENDRLRNFAEVDLSVICGNERCDPGEQLVYLFDETVRPVCSPDFLARHGPLGSAGLLAETELLELHPMHWSSDAIGWTPLSWKDWFRSAGHPAPERPFRLVSNSYLVLVEAGLRGEGMLLGWDHLVGRHLEQGLLVPAQDGQLRIDRGYYLKINAASAERPLVREFVDFILDGPV
ncbi:LysR substrate-binding domain-containing protein [Poseidonocella sp. HB161398]|uniref:LysR substrate-binding domain-containing protein n=1 Tax=Poseidonocella sp. HB161398 TaxID=2320855 RepID=UPI001108443C|nr:LysR substrate-binding domain-containing protein [Poseidonocella sp. HB161398]